MRRPGAALGQFERESASQDRVLRWLTRPEDNQRQARSRRSASNVKTMLRARVDSRKQCVYNVDT